MRLKERVAIVTGAAQGIGAAIAREFACQGATVVAIDRNPDVGRVCGEISAGGGSASAAVFDITGWDAYRSCVAEVAAKHGKIDILVNNAAIVYYASILEDDPERWREVIRVNLEALYFGSKLVAPHMVKAGYGRIVNIASAQAIASEPRVGAYTASKGGIMSYTKALAVELAPFGVLVNAIAPGCIHTPMSIIDGVDETQTDFFRQWYVGMRKIPLARAGEPEEIARAALFLASEDCSYMTGHTMVVDGGLTITF